MTQIVRPKPPVATMMSSVSSPTPPIGYGSTSAPTAASRPQPPARPMPPQVPSTEELPKEASHEQRTTESAQPPKVAAPLPERYPPQPRPRPVYSEPDAAVPESDEHYGIGRADTPEEATGQLTMIQLHSMTIMDRHTLWNRLNQGAFGTSKFVTLLRATHLPKRVAREDAPSGGKPGKDVMWCCYCGDWTLFKTFSYVGSDRCIGCGISTKDYYNRSANGLWQKEV